MNNALRTELRKHFGENLQENASLSRYTSARLGGPADLLLIVRTADELATATASLWELNLPVLILGGGSNVLVSDKGVRGAVLINRARHFVFNKRTHNPCVEAESGATLNDLVQRAANHGLSGLEWAVNVPGSLGGAIYGNAGAFGYDMANNLVSVDILHRQHGRETWSAEKMAYGYRSSTLKRQHEPAVILRANMALTHGKQENIKEKMTQLVARRRQTQPPGASMGCMFKNPPGDRAGRLIEAAGLKGRRIGNVEISSVHANFFINHGSTEASHVLELVHLVQEAVFEQSGIRLELEIELVGEWQATRDGHE